MTGRSVPDGLSSATPIEPVPVSPLRASIPSAGNFYRTCKNCAFDGPSCDRRKAIAVGVRGLGLTSIKFRCADRQPFYRVGQRVGVTWRFALAEWCWSYEDGLSEEEWPATIVAETTRGFRIVVDDVPSDHDTPARDYIKSASLYCNVTATRLRALDEPDRQVCTACGSADNGDGTVTGCWGGEGVIRVSDCLAQAIDARRAETHSGSVHESAVLKGCAQDTSPPSSPQAG